MHYIVRTILAVSCIASTYLLVQHVNAPAYAKETPARPKLFDAQGNPHPALMRLLALTNIATEKPDNESWQAYIMRATQDAWLRRPDQERWHLDQTLHEHHDAVLATLEELNVTQAIEPQYNTYDAIGVLGAAAPRLRQRIDHAFDILQDGVSASHLIIFAGQRPRSPERESRDVLAACCDPAYPMQEDEQLPETEEEIAYFILKHIQTPHNAPTIHVVSAPCHEDGSRPNTRDTIKHWYAGHTQHIPERILLISNQPFVWYQDTVARTALPESMHVETVGEATSVAHTPTRVILDTVARWIYATVKHT